MPRLTAEHVTGSLPGYDFTTEEVDLAVDRVKAWLTEDLGLPVLPDELPSIDWADGLQLAILVVTNPEMLAQTTRGPTSRMWPIKMQIDEIRKRIQKRGQAAVSGPRGSYPPPPVYPDPAWPSRGHWGPW
jgi:hypothetical protein